jgi:hypothetical protein
MPQIVIHLHTEPGWIVHAHDVSFFTLSQSQSHPYSRSILMSSVPFFYSVVLSEAKDLIAACHGHEILRCAQDDNEKGA